MERVWGCQPPSPIESGLSSIYPGAVLQNCPSLTLPFQTPSCGSSQRIPGYLLSPPPRGLRLGKLPAWRLRLQAQAQPCTSSACLLLVRECPSSDFILTNPDHAWHILPWSWHETLGSTLKAVGTAVPEHCGKLYQLRETVPVAGNCNSSHVSIPLTSSFIYYINWLPLQGLTQSSSHKSIPVKVSTL